MVRTSFLICRSNNNQCNQTDPFRKTWQHIGNIDQFRWLPRADVLDQLRLARDELGVRYVRAVAMYSPELGVWDHDLADSRKSGEKTNA
jgi:hypothetical protein